MAKRTDISLRSQFIYQIFPRQHSQKQNFQGIIDDLDRLKNLGVDIIYLLPIHPIGKLARKGKQGSPYSIIDYYQIHEELGTLDDFKSLVNQAHKRGIKVMMDIVFNHTSRDSKLVFEHPDWFYRNSEGELANRIGDWSDITDLDFNKRPVWDYLIEVLSYWAQIVDGFRCDVAPLLPLDFWIEARNQVDMVNPNLIWLTETVEYGFIKFLRDNGFECSSDSQMYEAFDIGYDYDISSYMDQYLKDGSRLSRWLEEIMRQEVVYPKNYIKLRNFENHDQMRLRSKTRDHNHFMQMISLMFFLKGPTMIYGGMEHEIDHAPNLYANDLIPWKENNSISDDIRKLAQIKKQPIFIEGNINLHNSNDIAVISYSDKKQCLLGIFNLENQSDIQIPLMDGNYTDILNGQSILVINGKIKLGSKPIIIDTKKEYLK